MKGTLDFKYLICDADMLFFQLETHEEYVQIDFTGSTFNKVFDLTDSKLNTVPVLVNTKFTNQVRLAQFTYEVAPRTDKLKELGSKYNSEDLENLIRLRELAESNNDNTLARRIHADEMLVKRWQKGNRLKAPIDILFSFFSNYGDSFNRPTLGLVFFHTLFASVYTFNYRAEATLGNWVTDLALSSSNIFPFLGSTKLTQKKWIEGFDADLLTNNFYIIMNAHSFISFVFLFLIGLGLRNTFRL